jgi:hypothetical protein
MCCFRGMIVSDLFINNQLNGKNNAFVPFKHKSKNQSVNCINLLLLIDFITKGNFPRLNLESI